MPLVTSIVTCAKKTSQFFHSAVTGTRGVKEGGREGLKGAKGSRWRRGKNLGSLLHSEIYGDLSCLHLLNPFDEADLGKPPLTLDI